MNNASPDELYTATMAICALLGAIGGMVFVGVLLIANKLDKLIRLQENK